MNLNEFAQLIGILVGIQVLVTAMGAIVIGYLNLRTRADLSTFRSELLETVEKKLDAYLHTREFITYSESHAKEHASLNAELVRLRDWKHKDVDPLLRKMGADIDDLTKGQDESSRS